MTSIIHTTSAYAGKAWIAAITARDPKFGLKREFLSKRDITNGGQTYRKIEWAIPAVEGAVYEYCGRHSSSREVKCFWQVRDGQLVAIDRAAVENYLG